MSEQSTLLQHLTQLKERAGLSFEELHCIDEVINSSNLMRDSLIFARQFNDMKAGAMYLGINVAKSTMPSDGPISLRLAAGRLFQLIVHDIKRQQSNGDVINERLKEEMLKVRFDVLGKQRHR